MKSKKLNFIGDCLSTSTGAFLSFVLFTYLGLPDLTVLVISILAALFVFKLARKCDAETKDTATGEDAYPISLFASIDFACLATTLVLNCFWFVFYSFGCAVLTHFGIVL